MFENEFSEAIRQKGFEPGPIVNDGEYHRFDIRKGDKAGFYNLDAEGRGVFGNWKTSEQFIFRSGGCDEMTEDQRRAARGRFRAEERSRREEKEKEHARIAVEARKIWNVAPSAEFHPYLEKKGIKPHGTRIDPSGVLLVPIYKNDQLVNLQRISLDRKLFLAGAEKAGCYSFIGGDNRIIFISEGFATAASINECTGMSCFVALDAGNLKRVARFVRDKYGVGQKIVIAADNDQWTMVGEEKKNVGVISAQEACEGIYASMLFPDFLEDDPEKRTDWNDYFLAFGKSATREKLLPVLDVAERQKELREIAREEETCLDYDENGRPKCTIENLKKICDGEKITIRYNVIKKQDEILIPDESFSVDNVLNASYMKVVSICSDIGMSTAHTKGFVTYLADKNLYNPVATWIKSKPWDGVSRLDDFYDTVTCKNSEIRDVILRKWMISAVAAAFLPNGISAHGVLVFQGEQYLGKTSWFKKLAPPELESIKDGYILRLDNKDSIFQCVSHWLVELGELEATFRKSDIAQLKAFITSDRDILRRAYAASESFYARRTVFFASVNQKEFLFDETGNRRFWTLETTSIDYDHQLDMQQVWAEFYELFKSGESWIMSSTEMAIINSSNEEFMGADYHEELVARRLDWKSLELFGGVWKTVTELCIMFDVKNPKQTDLNRISKAVKKYNGNQVRRSHGGIRLLLVPAEHLSSGDD